MGARVPKSAVCVIARRISAVAPSMSAADHIFAFNEASFLAFIDGEVQKMFVLQGPQFFAARALTIENAQ
jgi:hypothetical protein